MAKLRKIVLIVSVLFLQIWIASGSECGFAPSVTLNCDDRSAHVHWAPSQADCHFDCKGYWTCWNPANISNQTSSISCVQDWKFNIPWDYYFCSVTVFYKYFSLTTYANEQSPNTTKSCEKNLIEIQRDKYSEVGRPYEASCTVYTGKMVNSDNVSINWIGPDGVIANNSSRITIVPTTSDGYIHTSTLQFSYISEEDENTSYNCTASLFGDHEPLSESFTMNILTFEIQRDDYSEVGRPYEANCIVNASEEIYPNISWNGPDGLIPNDSSRITVITTTSDGYIHTSTLQFSYISEEDENTSYNCTVSLSGDHKPLSKSFTMSNLMIPQPNVTVKVINQKVGNPLSLECNVNIVRGITSNVEILWMADKEELRKENGIVAENITAYTYYYNNSKKLTSHDNNTVYSCHVLITSSQSITVTDNVTLYVETISPSPAKTSPASTMTTINPHPSTTIAKADPSSIDIPLIISSSAVVTTVALIICFAGYCIYIGKRNFKFSGFNSRYAKQLPIPQWSIDDDYYTVLGVETSTIDNEYINKGHKWMNHYTEMSTLEEERSSSCSPTSVTNEKMLDYIMHTKEHDNTNAASTHDDTQYCENYNVSGMIKNDTGCSSESLTRENGLYISEKAAFGNKIMSVSVQEEKPLLVNEVKEEKLVRSASSQIVPYSPNQSSYITLDSQFEQRSSSPFQIAAEERNGSPTISEGDYFPDTIAEIQSTSDSSTSPNAIEEKYGNGNSPTISEGEYLPWTSAVNQYDSVSVTKLFQQNCSTGIYNAVPVDSLKQETLNNYDLPYVELTEDDISHTAPHTHTCTDKETTIDINEYDASHTVVITTSHSDVPPYNAHQDKCAC